MQNADTSPSTETSPRRCRGCGYVLEHLSTPRCPECGRAFDFADPRTYAQHDPARAFRADVQMIALGEVAALLWIAVPWMAAMMLRLAPAVWLAAWAGLSGFVFVMVWPVVFTARRTLYALISAVPACVVVIVQAVVQRDYLSAGAAGAGPLAAALVRRIWPQPP